MRGLPYFSFRQKKWLTAGFVPPLEEFLDSLKGKPFSRCRFAALQFGVPFATVSASSTPKTAVGFQSPAQQAVNLIGFNIGFDGTSSTQGPAIVELGQCTWATNGPGTNSTSVTPAKFDSGRPETIQTTAAKNWTSEPTVITVVDEFLIPVYMGSGIIYVPLTSPWISKGGGGAVMRVTLPSAVTANCTGALKCME